MSTHYELLGLPASAPPDEIKRAFRREVARYHPDKVQHLGPEFQEIANTRSAALTEAYRVLMDVELRREYDEQIASQAPGTRGPVPAAAAQQSQASPHADPRDPTTRDRPHETRGDVQRDSATHELVRRAVLGKLREAVANLGGEPGTGSGFDAVYRIAGRKGLFRNTGPTVRIAVKIAPRVDQAALEATWPHAMRISAPGETVCLMLLGSGLAASKDLGGAISELRRRTRGGGPLVVPVDMRDWQALLPPETPDSIRMLLTKLRGG